MIKFAALITWWYVVNPSTPTFVKRLTKFIAYLCATNDTVARRFMAVAGMGALDLDRC